MINFSQADFGVILIATMAYLPMALWRVRLLVNEKRKTERYALFAVRDQWIRLVAEGHLSEDDESFQFLYKEINDIIPKAKPLTLKNIVTALRESRITSDPAFLKKHLQLLEHRNDHVRKATHEYLKQILTILVWKSVFLRMSVLVTHSSLKAVTTIRKALSRVFKTESEAYSIHRKLRDVCPV